MPGPWGKAIEALRAAKRLTRDTVARRAKMTPTTYGRIERGQHTQTRKLQDIADVFGVSIEQVLQSSPLPNTALSGNTAPSPEGQGQHGHSRAFQPISTTDTIHELQAQVYTLQQQLAEIVADREATRRRRRERVSTTRIRKPVRARNAGKSR